MAGRAGDEPVRAGDEPAMMPVMMPVMSRWRSGAAASAPTLAATLVATLAAALVVVAGGCSGDEQGGLEGASPGPDAVVGGEIDQIELFYDDLVVASEGSVVGPDGDELAVGDEVDTDIRTLILLDGALGVAGEYTVRHAIETGDGDRTETTYTFTFDPQGPPPQLVFVDEDEGESWIMWTVVLIGAAVLVVLTVRLAAAIRRLSRSRA